MNTKISLLAILSVATIMLTGAVAPVMANAVDCDGATITTQGVDKLIKYWLGPDGFGPFLVGNNEKIQAVTKNEQSVVGLLSGLQE